MHTEHLVERLLGASGKKTPSESVCDQPTEHIVERPLEKKASRKKTPPREWERPAHRPCGRSTVGPRETPTNATEEGEQKEDLSAEFLAELKISGVGQGELPSAQQTTPPTRQKKRNRKTPQE